MLPSALVGQRAFRTFSRWCAYLLTTLTLAVSTTAYGQPAEAVGVRYAQTLNANGQMLVLNGTGVAYRALAKLYTVGLYVPAKADHANAILTQNGAKQLRFVLLKGMRVDELGKLITRGIEHNCTRQEFFDLIPAIRQMGEQFARIQRLQLHDTFTIAYHPNQGTVFMVNEEPVGPPIKDTGFFNAILKVWVGEQPTTADLKNALLNLKAQPVLSALD